jgi:FAD/FMN-containing dehydrogenase
MNTERTSNRSADLTDGLREAVDADVAWPGDPAYERVTPWNLAVSMQPGAVVFAASAGDVAETMRFAGARGLRVAVQATGHGSVPVGAQTIVVQTGAMTTCVIDVENRTARVGAGVKWQAVVEAASPHGLAPLCGSAPGVGVVGYLTGAGIGPLVRSMGLSSDYVRSFVLVTGAGDILRVTAEQHADLFWGVRGGRSMLGIVTEVEIDLLPIAEFYGGAVYFDGPDVAAVLREWRRWCATLPEWINTSIALQRLPEGSGVPEPLAGKLTVAVRYTALGDFTEAQRLLVPMRAVATPVLDTIAVRPYSAIGTVHADPVHPMPTTEQNVLLAELTAEAVDVLLGFCGQESLQTTIELRMLGGALAREPQQRSAFCHRDAAFALTIVGVTAQPDPAAVTGQAEALVAAMAPWSTGGQLANFAVSLDPGRPARVYTENTMAWLSALAAQYDPAHVLAPWT